MSFQLHLEVDEQDLQELILHHSVSSISKYSLKILDRALYKFITELWAKSENFEVTVLEDEEIFLQPVKT